MKEYDLIVIGGGSGGIAGARRAASYGAKVALCEKADLGGTCVNLGCVPKKFLYYAAEFAEYFSDSKNYGWGVKKPEFSWERLLQNKNKEIKRLNSIYQKLLQDSKVDIFNGTARFVNNNEISVGASNIKAKKILIATGGKVFVPDIPGKEYAIISDDMFFLKELPKKITIVGGGFIALEFAFIMKGLGSDVRLVVRGDRVLRNFDHDVSTAITEEIEKKKIEIATGVEVKSLSKKGGSVTLHSNKGWFEGDAVLFATGRTPNLDGLGLENTDVQLDSRGMVEIDSYCETAAKSIFAVGDITGKLALTPVAINQSRAFADTEFGNNKRKIDYNNIAAAVFTRPEIGTVGLTEEQAKKEYGKVKIFKASFRPLKNNLSGNESREFMKLIVDEKSDKVVGVHIIGKDAAEMIQMCAVALKCGATKKQFDETIGVHPTSAEELVTMR